MLRLPPSSVKNAWSHESFSRSGDGTKTFVGWPNDEHCWSVIEFMGGEGVRETESEKWRERKRESERM